MPSKPTPGNIISITYQLLQEINVPQSIRGQMPVITIQFQDDSSIVRSKVVSFQEMLPYLRYLKTKAVSLGKILSCVPETTFDTKIVVEMADPIAPPVDADIFFALDGSQFGVPQNLTVVANCIFTQPWALYVPDITKPPIFTFDMAKVLFDGFTRSFYEANMKLLGGTLINLTEFNDHFTVLCTIPNAINGNTYNFSPVDLLSLRFEVNGVNFEGVAHQMHPIGGYFSANNAFQIDGVPRGVGVCGWLQMPKLGGANFSDDYTAGEFNGQIEITDTLVIGGNWIVMFDGKPNLVGGSVVFNFTHA